MDLLITGRNFNWDRLSSLLAYFSATGQGDSATARITDIVTYHESGNRYSHYSQDSRRHEVYIDYRYHGQRYTDIRLDTYTPRCR